MTPQNTHQRIVSKTIVHGENYFSRGGIKGLKFGSPEAWQLRGFIKSGLIKFHDNRLFNPLNFQTSKLLNFNKFHGLAKNILL